MPQDHDSHESTGPRTALRRARLAEHRARRRLLIDIEGAPNIHVELACTLDDPKAAGIDGMSAGAGAMVATAMRVVNAVPYVVDAPPGLLSAMDLPTTVPPHAFG